jgi:hypothetical protein
MNTTNRRRFLQLGAFALAAPLAARLAIPAANAQALPKLPLDHPQGKALAYVEDAATTKHVSFKPGSNCANCQFFTAANGACTLFAGFSVAPKGWCAAWAKKA